MSRLMMISLVFEVCVIFSVRVERRLVRFDDQCWVDSRSSSVILRLALFLKFCGGR